MINNLEMLKEFMNENQIYKKDVCIVGSSILAANGLRKNNDIDFIINPNQLNKLGIKKRHKVKFSFAYSYNKDLKLYKNKYQSINIVDKDIFNYKLFNDYKGFNIILPEIEYLYKEHRNLSKDKKDIVLLNSIVNFKKISDIKVKNNNKVKQYIYITKFFITKVWSYFLVKIGKNN